MKGYLAFNTASLKQELEWAKQHSVTLCQIAELETLIDLNKTLVEYDPDGIWANIKIGNGKTISVARKRIVAPELWNRK